MSWEVGTQGAGSGVPTLADDMYDAVCCWVVDLGTQTIDFEGKLSHKPKVLVGWAVDGEFVDINGEKKPRMVSKEYVVSLHERATLRKDLEGWRGKPFEKVDKFDIGALIGKSCRLLIGTTSTGKSNKVEAVKAKKKDVQIPAGLDRIYFRLSEWDGIATPAVPQWVLDKIAQSPEWQSKRNVVEGNAGTPEREVQPDSDEDVPF